MSAKTQNDRRKRNRDLIRLIKDAGMCAICGEDHPAVLQFHHTNNKSATITQLVQRGVGLPTLRQELDKCMLLCANCHLIFHYNEVSHEATTES